MAAYIVKHSFNLFKQKPIKLWGISILCSVVTTIITLMGLLVPIITIPLNLVITAGMSLIYLNGYNGIMPDTADLFAGFDKSKAGHVAGGMCWHELWTIIWMFVPIANIVKILQYSFTPYILMTRPEVSPTEALKCSIKETRGYKAPMFFTFLVIYLAVAVVSVILTALAEINYIGALFAVILFLFNIAEFMFLPLLTGVIEAGFYQEAQNAANGVVNYASYGQQRPAAPSYNVQQWNPAAPVSSESQNGWACGECGTVNAAGTKYCRACGSKNPETEQSSQPADDNAPQA